MNMGIRTQTVWINWDMAAILFCSFMSKIGNFVDLSKTHAFGGSVTNFRAVPRIAKTASSGYIPPQLTVKHSKLALGTQMFHHVPQRFLSPKPQNIEIEDVFNWMCQT